MGSYIDIIGKRFGKLVVLKRVDNIGKRIAYLCRCDCGNEKIIVGESLREGKSHSCGCAYRADITGQRFGRLTVIAFHHRDEKSLSYWTCKCDCGNTVVKEMQQLKFGQVMSCGCLQKETRIRLKTKHNLCHTRLFRIWSGIRNRCNNPNEPAFKHYGGRGITICGEWVNNFQAFYDWAMANGYGDSLSIDRIDNNGNYEPSNCRWVDIKTQNNNRRCVRKYEINGQWLSKTDIAEKYGVSYGTVCSWEKSKKGLVARLLESDKQPPTSLTL